MKKISYLFAALMLTALASGTIPPTLNAAHADEAADKAKQTSVRAEMGKPLNEIQELLTNKQYPQALEKIEALNALENKTPYELFALDRLRAVVASGTNDTPLLAKSFEKMIVSEFLKDAEKLRLIEAMAGTYFNEKNYDQAKLWALRYLDKDRNSQSMRNLLVRALYLQNDFAGTIKEINTQLADDDQAKRVPQQDNLRLLAASYQQTKDTAGYTAVLERMVEHYPQKDYWGDLIYRIEHKPGFNDRLRLDLYRLLMTTENMEEAPQYVEMTELLLLAGLPAEAKKVVEAGFAANLMGAGKEAAKHKQLRDKVMKQAADDAKSLDAGEAAAKAAKTGTGMVNIGYNYVINGQFDKGIELMEQGIAKGGLKSADEARLHLGMAYLQAGKRDRATEVFKTIQGNDGAADLGRLWLLVRK